MLDLDAGPWADTAGWCAKTQARLVNARAEHGADFLLPYYGSEKGGRSLDRPVGTLTTVDRYALVRGDRGRMLTVAEALRLSSFPDGYRLAGNRRDGMKLTGNCVPPLLAAHVIRSVVAQVFA